MSSAHIVYSLCYGPAVVTRVHKMNETATSRRLGESHPPSRLTFYSSERLRMISASQERQIIVTS